MKIAIILYGLSGVGGSQRQALSLAKELEKLGHRVVFFASHADHSKFPDILRGINLHVVAPPSAFSAVAGGRWGGIMEKLAKDRENLEIARRMALEMDDDFDVINGHDYHAYKVGYFYKKLKNPRTKFVWMMNEIPFSYLPKDTFVAEVMRKVYSAAKAYRERKYFRAVDLVATLNTFDAKWIKKTYGLDSRLVQSGCDFEKFYVPVRSRKAGDPLRLLTVGIFGPHRRFEDTITATALLRKHGIDARAIILGSFGNESDAYAKRLRVLIKDFSIEANVHMSFRSRSEEEIKKLYEEADVFVFPTYVGHPRYGYGWGLAAFEAMSAGLLVALYSSTASVRLLRGGENAIIVHPLRPDLIAERLEKVARNPECYYKMALAGQEFVKNKMSWKKYAEDMLGIFEEALRT